MSEVPLYRGSSLIPPPPTLSTQQGPTVFLGGAPLFDRGTPLRAKTLSPFPHAGSGGGGIFGLSYPLSGQGVLFDPPQVLGSYVQGYFIYKKTHPPRTLPS